MMFSDSKLTRDTDLSKLTELVNSKRIYRPEGESGVSPTLDGIN